MMKAVDLSIDMLERIQRTFAYILLKVYTGSCNFQIPDGVNVSKEARLAISKAASVFVLYATSW